MFFIYGMLFLALKKVQIVKIPPCQIPNTQDSLSSYWGDFPSYSLASFLENTVAGIIFISPKLQISMFMIIL